MPVACSACKRLDITGSNLQSQAPVPGSSDMDKVGFSADLPIANDTGNVAPVPKLRHSNEAQ